MRAFLLDGVDNEGIPGGGAERGAATSLDAARAAALLGHKTTQMVETTYGAVLDTQEPVTDDEILRRVA